MARLNWVVTSEPSPDPRYWNRVLVDEAYPRASLHAAGYQGERIRKIFLNGDIEYRHFYRARSTALLLMPRGFR